MMIYDVAVIGAGVSGASTAYQLAHYNLSTVLLEKCADVCFGVSKANSGIIHGGFHHPVNTLKAKLEIRGTAVRAWFPVPPQRDTGGRLQRRTDGDGAAAL